MSGFALLVATLFTLYALAFAYTVEDQFIERMLRDEAKLVLWQADAGVALRPHSAQLYASVADLPDDLRRVMAEEPMRTEVAGDDGRHYHLTTLTLDGATVWLVAEVGEQLVFRRMRSAVIEILGWSTLGALALALAIGYLIAAGVTRRVERLALRLDSLQPDALGSAFAADASDEVAALEHGIAELLSRLNRFVAREQAFTRDASHELRTPLTIIQSAAEQLATQPHDAQAAQRIATILTAAQQMARTLQALLTLARADTRTSAPVRVAPAIERCILEHAALLDRTAIRIDVNVAAGAVIAVGEDVLDIVLRNLIGNAIAHSPPQSAIDVRSGNGRLRISNPSEHPLSADAFDEFSKGADSPGIGLGLSILKRLDERFALDLQFRHDAAAKRIDVSFRLA